mmetsp:Transcript_45538/g.113072  ORF Transcript_45538/g.113072 Transcript_45538/m.113072 type:complete len:143 (+) Transcript_45538:343-771(+)
MPKLSPIYAGGLQAGKVKTLQGLVSAGVCYLNHVPGHINMDNCQINLVVTYDRFSKMCLMPINIGDFHYNGASVDPAFCFADSQIAFDFAGRRKTVYAKDECRTRYTVQECAKLHSDEAFMRPSHFNERKAATSFPIYVKPY